MARNPFPRQGSVGRYSESSMQFPELSNGDDDPPLPKEKDVVKKHGNGVESFSVMKNKSRKRSNRSTANALTTNKVNGEERATRKQRNQTDASTTSNGEERAGVRQRNQTDASTTSNGEERARMRPRKQRHRSNGTDKKANAMQRDHQKFQTPRGDQRSVMETTDDYEEGNTSERERLLPANGSNLSAVIRGNPRPNGYGDAPGNQIDFQPHPEEIFQRRLPDISLSTERFFSFILFLLILVLGMAFVISSNIKSDRHGLEITPRVVNCYLIVLITFFMIWLGFDLWGNKNCLEGTLKESGSLIPSHLLNGVGLFGIGSSVCQVVTILDFWKCRRNVPGLDTSSLVYPFFEMAFMFSQIYIFYTLSMNRQRQMWFGNTFTMLTLGMNLTIWTKYFFAGAVNNVNLKNETWLTHYYYGVSVDLCSENNTGVNSRALHQFWSDMIPYMYTLAMEYSLLASALLLHLWLGIAIPNAGEYGTTNRKKWEIWRFGFFLGLLCLPLLGITAVNASVEFDNHKITIVYSVQLFFFTLVFFCSIYGRNRLKSTYVVARQPIRVDIILLCVSWLGFLIIDLFTIFAACCEMFSYKKHRFKSSEFIIGVSSLFELCSTATLVTFIVTAYSHTLRCNPRGYQAAKKIRQISSFLLIVSFGFWAMRTYTFRSSYTFDFVGSKYFNKFSWFVITLLSVPFCTFFHFHSAVCLTEVIASSTVQ